MKRILMLFLLLLALFGACAAAESVVIDKTDPKNAGFEFSGDAQLLEVYFPRIYGVDAALVRFGDYTMLIDCAGNQRREVKRLLDDLGVTELTYALNSHPDADHIGGFQHILDSLKSIGSIAASLI